MQTRNGLRILQKKKVREKTSSFKKEEENLISAIKNGKYEDLFSPLNAYISKFRNEVLKCFPEIVGVKGYTLIVLKIIAYLKTLKDSNKKYLPNFEDQNIIIGAVLLYDIAYFKNIEVESVLEKVGLIFKKDRTENTLLFDKIDSLIRSIEYARIDYTDITKELDHYDPKIKFLRVLKEPKLDVLLKNIFIEINEKSLLPFVKDFENGTHYLNLVKKLGLKYINSRSNFEWYLYSKNLKKIRNFLSRDKYFNFLKIIKEELQIYKRSLDFDNEKYSFNKNENLYYLEIVLNRLYEQRIKKHAGISA